MTFTKTLGIGALAAAALAMAIPSLASADTRHRPHHPQKVKVCKWERHHGKKVKVCHWVTKRR